jgi:hypothetical protein
MVEAYLNANVPESLRVGLFFLLDGMASFGFVDASQEAREQILQNVAAFSPDAAAGVDAFRQLTLLMAYGAPDQTGRNPNWVILGYPGPISAPSPEPKPIQPVAPTGGVLTLEADVCMVGSGAGGGVIAGTLAEKGQKVVVLEAGGYYNEADFNQLELWAYQHLYYRGGYFPSADGNVILVAGATLGGGTTVNWMNCLRTRPGVRAQWAQEFGLEGLDSPEYDRHFDAILSRLSANDQCSDFNGPHQRLKEGSCRMGKDRATSVANPWGELHDTRGVWIGDGSAFPTAPGTNPMISIMALARRTAEAIAAS